VRADKKVLTREQSHNPLIVLLYRSAVNCMERISEGGGETLGVVAYIGTNAINLQAIRGATEVAEDGPATHRARLVLWCYAGVELEPEIKIVGAD